MANFYTGKAFTVKAGYTIRIGGRVWHMRLGHLEVLAFLRLAMGRAA